MSSPKFQDSVLLRNPLAYYRLDESSGSIHFDGTDNDYFIFSDEISLYAEKGPSTFNPYSRRASTQISSSLRLSEITSKTFEFLVYVSPAHDSSVTVVEFPRTVTEELSVELTISAVEKKIGFGYGQFDWDMNDLDSGSSGPLRNIFWSSESLILDTFNHVIVSTDNLGNISVFINGEESIPESSVCTFDIDNSDVVGRTVSYPVSFLRDHNSAISDDYVSFSNLTIYSSEFSLEDAQDHYNILGFLETILESYLVPDIIPIMQDTLEPIYEYEYAGTLGQRLDKIRISTGISVRVKSSQADDFDRRILLDDEGYLETSLDGASVEPDEPGAGAYLATEWYEIPFSSEDFEKAYVSVSAPNSSVRVRVFKAPFLDAIGDDTDDIIDDEDIYVDFSELIPVTSASVESIFTLDENYGSNYFIQVILLSGDGLNVEFEWGSADPLPGGEFVAPITLNNSEVGLSLGNSSTNAYVEAGEPVSSNVDGEVSITRSVWFEWDSPEVVEDPIVWNVNVSDEADFTVEFFKVIPEDPFTGFSTFSTFDETAENEPTFSSLSEVVSDYSIGGGSLDLEFTPEPSTKYRVKIGTNSNEAGVSLMWAPPIEEVPAAEPFKQVRVTVHAGASGGEYDGQTFAPNEFITELPNRTGLQFQEALNTPGTGSISLLQNDPVLRAFSPPGWTLVGDPSAPNLSGTSLLSTTSSVTGKNAKTINITSPLPSNVVKGVTLQIGDGSSGNSKLVRIAKRNSPTSFNITHNLGFALPAGSPIYTTLQPEDDPFRLLRVGNFVKFWVDDKCVSGFVIKNREIPIVGSSEEAEKTITVSGPTFLYLLNDIVVMHDESSRNYTSEDRAFDWKSPVTAKDMRANGGWFDAGGTYRTNIHAWNHPVRANGIKNPPGWRKRRNEPPRKRPKFALAKAKRKKRFPAPKAKWMWMSRFEANKMSPKFKPVGFQQHYYRAKKLNITKSGRYRLTVNSDTMYEVYLDGALIMSGNGLERYTRNKSRILRLNPTRENNPNSLCVFVGDQKNGFRAKKKSKKKSGKKAKKVLKRTKVDADHNDAILLTVQRLKGKKGQKVAAGGAVLNSAGRRKWFAYHGSNPPAWSRAQVLMTLLREGAERNNDSAKLIYNATRSAEPNLGRFSSDRGGGKALWHDLKKYSSTIKVGTSLLDVQSQFSEIRRFDVWIDPDTMRLYAWQGSSNGVYPRGTNRSANVALVPGQNLISYSVSEVDQMVNTLLVQYTQGDGSGFVVVEPDVNSPQGDLATYYGTREGYFEAGGYHSAEKATEISEALLTSLIDTTKLADAGDIVGHINESYSGSIIPVKGSVPFLDFNVGDTISAPGYNGIMHPHRVLSLTCTEDSEGNLIFEPELEGS